MTLNTSVTPTSITTTPDFTALATQYTAAVPPTTLPANATVATPVCV